MSRNNGLIPISANFETRISSPLDARLVANTINDLTNESYWLSGDSNTYLYNGIAVAVWNDGDNNGVYILTDESNYQDINSWLKIGSPEYSFADQTETNAGVITDKVIAPNTLAGWWTYVKGLAQTFAQKITFTSGALFSPQVDPTYERGRIYFDNANDCISFMDSISGTSVQVGYEVLMRARNNTGATIPNGSVVYISGAIGQNSTVALAQANTLPTSEIIGLATHDIANNTVGKICVFGLVNELNTSSFTDGQMLYISATVAGGLASTIPASPNFVVALGVVEHAHPTQGKILVRPQRALANNNALGTAQNVPPTQNAVKSALDLKQDKLTETNFAQFMDVALATKLTPSPNDTFVGRDSLTNEAVEFQISHFQEKIQQITPVTLLSGGWTLVSGLYQYTYSNVNITTTTIVDVIPDNSTIEIVKTAEILPQTNSSNGSVTLFSKNLPTSNIVVTINIIN